MNKSLIISVFLLALCFSSQKAKAQFDVHFSQYWDLNGYYIDSASKPGLFKGLNSENEQYVLMPDRKSVV